jgi:REP element-mobilizing transposase RayT
VWSTKKREPYIDKVVKDRLYGYIKTVSEAKQQKIIIINGMPDHIHILANLLPHQNVADYVKNIKTASTKWVRTTFGPTFAQFAWQEGYGGYTVGYSSQKATYNYILNQEKKHENLSFEDEYLNFIKMQNISFDEKYVLD